MAYFSQEQVFIFFFIIGVIVSILFDVFRALRKNFKATDIVTFIQDLSFFIISGFLILFGIIKLNNGEIRLYIFIAIFLGALMYFLTISNICVIILNVIVGLCKKIILFPITIYKFLITKTRK